MNLIAELVRDVGDLDVGDLLGLERSWPDVGTIGETPSQSYWPN